jgi:citrate synthase
LINMKEIAGHGLLSAQDAAAELGVTVATLYAYVSRGYIRSEMAGDGRGRRYRAEDIQALRARRAPPDANEPDHEPKVWDAPLLDSAITQMSARGPVYRGALAVDLARGGASFERVCEILWDAAALQPFQTKPAAFPKRLALMAKSLEEWPATDRAAAMMALASETDPSAHRRSAEGVAETSARIVRWVAALMAGTEPSAEPAHLVLARKLAPQRKEAAGLIRQALVLLADHELNPSTFAVRVAASTGISLYDAVAAGLVALKGSHHGGATTRAARFVAAASGEGATREIRARAALNEPVPGFGHALYAQGDPRAAALLQAMAEAGLKSPLISDIPQSVFDMIGERPNIDYALAVLGRVLGFPEGGEISVLVLARTAGWLAHAREQFASGRLIRPRARYTGPALRGQPR